MADGVGGRPLRRGCGGASSISTVALWVAAAASVALYLYLNVFSLRGATLTDFHVYYEALRRAMAGEQVYLRDSPMPFLYPPFFLVLIWPLGWLSEPAAASLWLYGQSVLLVVSLAAFWAAALVSDRKFLALAVIVATAYSPVALNNLYGQSNLLYLAIVGLFVLAYLGSGRAEGQRAALEMVAAALLSVAISIRILPVALLAMAAIQRRWRFVLLTAAMVLVEAIVAGVAVGFSVEGEYFTSRIFEMRGLENMREISLWALAQRAAGVPYGGLIYGLAVVSGCAIFLAFVFRPMKAGRPCGALHVAFVISSMVLFAPLLEYHHYVLLLGSYVLVLGHLWHRGPSVAAIVAVLLSWAIVSAANQMSYFSYGPAGFAALAGAALLWFHTVVLVAGPEDGPSKEHEEKGR